MTLPYYSHTIFVHKSHTEFNEYILIRSVIKKKLL